MSSNSFGNIFRITTFGESHGRAIGVVIDGCPAGLQLDQEKIQLALNQRAPGRNNLVSPRNEADQLEILSGLHEKQTTGAPLTILITNTDQDSNKYEPIKDLYRPGHANYTYLKKYGVFDYKGGGRASARETAVRVAAGAVAQQVLAYYDIYCVAYLQALGHVKIDTIDCTLHEMTSLIESSPLFCPCATSTTAMQNLLLTMQESGNSLGGIVAFDTSTLPTGLGDPMYEKLEANLAKAMMSIPASKGFEIGSGFEAALMTGFCHNDRFTNHKGKEIDSNHCGGLLGGISTGQNLYGRVAFKPTSSIALQQETTTISGQKAKFKLPEGSRHDPCVAIRAVPVVRAMLSLVLVDSLLMNRLARVEG